MKKLLVIILSLIILYICMVFWTDRTLDFWCTYFSGHSVNVPIWLSVLVSIVGNGVVLTLNIISEIIILCL